MKYISKISIILFILIYTNIFAVRIKDLASIRGMRENQLIGFSVVVGLNGTGDSPDSILSRKPLRNALERMGISIGISEMKGRSIAAVMVTATLPAFAKQGQKIDVRVSAIGDAISLRGGTLVLSPLRAPNREVFAVAQGPLGGIPLGIERDEILEITKNATPYEFDPKKTLLPTSGRVIGGAIVEKELNIDLNARTRVYLNLKEPDFTTAFRLAKAINRDLGDGSSKAVDAGTIEVSVPASYLGQTVELISRIEGMEIQPDAVAKVVLDERSGTIVMGTNVKILPVAISHGNLNINIGSSIIAKKESEEGSESNGVILFKGGVDLKEVVDGLNKIGISSSELIEVLKTIKSAGALKAELQIK